MKSGNTAIILRSSRLFYFCLLLFCLLCRKNMVQLLMNCGREKGLEVAFPRKILVSNGRNDLTEDSVYRNLTTLNKDYGPLQIVVIIMANTSDIYSEYPFYTTLLTFNLWIVLPSLGR